jgi:hypothetical protein
LDSYPEFTGPATIIGGIVRRADERVEVRAGFGGASYVADGARTGAAVTQIDAAAFPVTHVGLTLGLRWIAVPRYRGDRLSILPWAVGVRIR